MGIDNLLQDLLQLFLSYVEVNLQLQLIALDASVHKAQILRDDLVKDKASHRGLYHSSLNGSVRHLLLHSYFYLGVQRYFLVLIGKNGLVYVLEGHALSLYARSFLCQVVDTENHILGRNGHRASVGRL